MSDLISRQAAIDALGEKPLAWTEGEYELGLQNQWEHDVDAIKALPPVTPQPKTDAINKSNFSQEQYKADLQSAYDCGRSSIKPCEDAISRADAVRVASGYCHPANIAEELAKLPPVYPKQKVECSCDQIKWERDMAIAQLNELGYGLGEKPKVGHWIHLKHGKGKCSECHDVVLIAQMYGNANYCPNCGKRMIEPQESEREE